MNCAEDIFWRLKSSFGVMASCCDVRRTLLPSSGLNAFLQPVSFCFFSAKLLLNYKTPSVWFALCNLNLDISWKRAPSEGWQGAASEKVEPLLLHSGGVPTKRGDAVSPKELEKMD